jgi:hypothetical protein
MSVFPAPVGPMASRHAQLGSPDAGALTALLMTCVADL